jgi:hypothetical protein
MKCRHCNHNLSNIFIDLGCSPPSNAYLSEASLNHPETYYPLKVFVCEECWLVQTDDYTNADDLFTEDYAYFSSVSKSWLAHAKSYVDMIVARLGLHSKSKVLEIASNDGYLLKNFINRQIPCLGIEPTLSTAIASEKQGIPTIKEFFGASLTQKVLDVFGKPDLIIGNNVYPHVPDINDFTQSIKTILADDGTVTLEFQHILTLIENNQFDTIYHEHFSYLSLICVINIFKKFNLKIYDVEEISTHGGSLRIFGCHAEKDIAISPNVSRVLEKELNFGLKSIDVYSSFQLNANNIKNDFINFLIEKNREGKRVVAYGAAAKGNTLMNFAGIKSDLLPIVYDAAPSKQGKFMPGSRIPILNPKAINVNSIDYVVVFPWNIISEIKGLDIFKGPHKIQFVKAVPKLTIEG